MQAAVSAISPAEEIRPVPVVRNVAVDAYRGLVMFLMMAEVLRLSRVAERFRATGSGAFWPSTRRTSNGWAARCTT